MKRTAIALLAAVIVFATVYGLAASLGVTTNSLGSGNTGVAACQAATLTTTYATAYDATIPGYAVGVVTVGNLQSTCYSKAFGITLTNAANASIGTGTGTTPAAGSTFTFDFTSQHVNAATAANVVVTISG